MATNLAAKINKEMMHDGRPSIGGRMSINPAPQSFSFPPLKTNDIITCMNELGLHISESDLVEPEKNRDHIRKVLEHLAEICSGITREEMSQPAFKGLSCLNFPELHEDSVAQINSFRLCTKMMENCGIYDFSIKDFMYPTSKRFRRQLSGILNFAKFREERIVFFSDINETTEGLFRTLRAEKESNAALNKKLLSLREQTMEEASIIAKVEGECKDMESKISDLNNFQAEIREESASLKNLNNQLKDSLTAKSLEMDELAALKKKLSSQIVSSPARFKKHVLDASHAVVMEKKDAQIADKRVKELNSWVVSIEEAQCEVNSALTAIHDLSCEVENKKAAIVQLDSLRLTANNQRKALSDMDQNIHQLTRQCSRSEDKNQYIQTQATKRGTEMQQMIESLHKQLMDAENAGSQLRKKADRIEIEAQRQDMEAEAEFATMKQERADMIGSYRKLESVIVSHLQNLRRGFEDENIPANVI